MKIEVEVRPVTERERQVAELMAEGCDVHMIAQELRISLGMVKQYRVRLYRKLGISPGGKDYRQQITLGFWWSCELFQTGMRELGLVA